MDKPKRYMFFANPQMAAISKEYSGRKEKTEAILDDGKIVEYHTCTSELDKYKTPDEFVNSYYRTSKYKDSFVFLGYGRIYSIGGTKQIQD